MKGNGKGRTHAPTKSPNPHLPSRPALPRAASTSPITRPRQNPGPSLLGGGTRRH